MHADEDSAQVDVSGENDACGKNHSMNQNRRCAFTRSHDTGVGGELGVFEIDLHLIVWHHRPAVGRVEDLLLCNHDACFSQNGDIVSVLVVYVDNHLGCGGGGGGVGVLK